MRRALVTGGAGFIGQHLVAYLKQQGYWVRAVDIKDPEHPHPTARNLVRSTLREPDDWDYNCDLRDPEGARRALRGVFDEVYHLAADMGGIGYITSKWASIARNNSLINLNVLEACRQADVGRFLYTSSACIYPKQLQLDPECPGLQESQAWPAEPEDGYGLEKLYMEELVHYYATDYCQFAPRVARLHNVYGPYGTYCGGREKAPAAICFKVARASKGGEIKIWGDGKQTRSFLYVDDCVRGLYALMQSDAVCPLNIGSEEMVTIDQLVELVCGIAGKILIKCYDLEAPQGVRGRCSDNTVVRDVLGWEPVIPLREGLAKTYAWIEKEVRS